MGARMYSLLADHCDVAPGECVIEVGSERGEGSTRWLAHFCDRRKIPFYTVDIDPQVYELAAKLIEGFPYCSAHLDYGENFIGEIEEKIRFAYLDAFDCIPRGLEREPFIAYHKRRYQELGLTLTNSNSSASHLRLAQRVVEHAATRCTILIDDTELIRHRWRGKGAHAVPYLRTQKFDVQDVGGACLAVRTNG